MSTAPYLASNVKFWHSPAWLLLRIRIWWPGCSSVCCYLIPLHSLLNCKCIAISVRRRDCRYVQIIMSYWFVAWSLDASIENSHSIICVEDFLGNRSISTQAVFRALNSTPHTLGIEWVSWIGQSASVSPFNISRCDDNTGASWVNEGTELNNTSPHQYISSTRISQHYL